MDERTLRIRPEPTEQDRAIHAEHYRRDDGGRPFSIEDVLWQMYQTRKQGASVAGLAAASRVPLAYLEGLERKFSLLTPGGRKMKAPKAEEE